MPAGSSGYKPHPLACSAAEAPKNLNVNPALMAQARELGVDVVAPLKEHLSIPQQQAHEQESLDLY